jgi:hypothetical protein
VYFFVGGLVVAFVVLVYFIFGFWLSLAGSMLGGFVFVVLYYYCFFCYFSLIGQNAKKKIFFIYHFKQIKVIDLTNLNWIRSDIREVLDMFYSWIILIGFSLHLPLFSAMSTL